MDLNNGQLQAQIDAYKKRLQSIDNIKPKQPLHVPTLLQQLDSKPWKIKKRTSHLFTKVDIQIDWWSISYTVWKYSPRRRTIKVWEQSSKAPKKELLKVAWKIIELEEIMKICRQLTVDIEMLRDKLTTERDHIVVNIASSLTSIRNKLTDFVKKLSKHQRTPAIHIFVFMISPDWDPDSETICPSNPVPSYWKP